MNNFKTFSNRRGSVFVTTLTSVFLMTLVSGYVYQLGTRDLHFVHRLEKGAQAQQLAEAGLYKMFRELDSDWDAAVGQTLEDDLDTGSYSVSVGTVGERYLVESVGTAGDVTRTMSAEVSGGGGGGGSLEYAIAAGGNLEIDSGTADSPGFVDGSIYSGGNTELDGPSNGGVLDIGENVDAGGNIDIDDEDSVAIGGEQNPNYDSDPTFPTADMDYLRGIAQANGYYYTSDKTYTSAALLPSPPGGVIYTTGNVTIRGTQNATVCVVAQGNISIAKSGSTYPRVTITAPASLPNMVASGNITFTSTGNGGAYLTLTGLTLTNGNFTYSSGNHDQLTVTGSIQALGNVVISPTAQNEINITYTFVGDLNGVDNDAGGAEEFELVSFNN